MSTTAAVAAGLAELLGATQHDEQYFTADMTANAGGFEYPQYRDIIATSSGSVVSLTSKTPGVPFTATVAKTGTLTATHAAEDTAATGPWHFNAAANWEGGVAPGTQDVLIYDERSSSTYYALNNVALNISIERRNSFQGDIGLDSINATHGTLTYPEYRQTKLDLPITTTTGSSIHELGEPDSDIEAAGHTYLDFGTNAGNAILMTIYDVPAKSSVGGDAVLIAGGEPMLLTVYSGSVGVGLSASENPTTLNALRMFELSHKAKKPAVTLRPGASFTSGTDPIDIYAGNLTSNHVTSVVYEMFGGELIQEGGISTINVRKGAKVRHVSGNITTLVVFGGGEYDAGKATAYTITNTTLYAGFTFRDHSAAAYTNGIDFVGCSPADGVFDVESSLTWTPSAL